MTFASIGLAVAAIAGIAAPILIHFFLRRKHKPIEWAAMALLKRALERTARTRRFDQLVLLAVRCMLVLAAGLAIAGPLLKKSAETSFDAQSRVRERAIVLDDGIAQQATRGGSSGWEDARDRAIRLIDQCAAGDRVGIVRAVGARSLVWPPSGDLDAVRSELMLATPSFEGSDLMAAVSAATEGGRDVIVLSDFRAGSIGSASRGSGGSRASKGAQQASTKPPAIVLLDPQADQPLNVQAVAVETRASGPMPSRDLHPLRVKLQREGTTLPKATSTIEVRSDAGPPTTLRAEWDVGQALAQVDGTVRAPPSEQRADLVVEAKVIEADGQPADNAVYGVISGTGVIRVLLIDRALPDQPSDKEDTAATWLTRALMPIEGTDVAVESADPAAIDAARLRGVQAVMLLRPDSMDAAGWNVLSQAVRNGLVVWVFAPANESVVWGADFQRAFSLGWILERPTPQAGQSASQGAAERRIEAGQTPHPLLAQLGSELDTLLQPVLVNNALAVRVPANSGETVLSLSDGSPLLVRAQPTDCRGSVLLLSTAPVTEWTSLPTKPLMVPLVQEIVRQSISRVERAAVVQIGGIASVPGASTLEPTLHLSGSELPTARSITLDAEGRATQPVQVPGVYRADDARGRRVAWVIGNINLRAASIRSTPPGEVAALFEGGDAVIPNPPTPEGAIAAAPGIPVERGDAANLPVAAALDGVSLAPWFFAAAIVVLLVETWLARRASAGATSRALQGVAK
jgi:hypothetical protein